MKKWLLGLILCISGMGIIYAQKLTVPVYLVAHKGHGASVGTVTFTDSRYGMLIQPHFHNLSPGLHGFHIHALPSCNNNGQAAGGHLDPHKTGKHLGPYNPHGHLGDLPVLYVNKHGIANVETLAPRLKVSELHGHSVMIHAQGDNYSDHPAKLGGGGARIACGVIH